MEMNFGEWEMQRYDEIRDPRLQEWYDDFFNVAATGGESSREQQERVKAFFQDLKGKDYKTVGIFTHGGVISHSIMLANKGMSVAEAFKMQPGYGGVVELDVR